MSETMYTLIGTLLIVMMIPGGRHIVRGAIKVRARRKLSNRFHPDKFPSDDAALQAAANMCQQTINAQWEIYEATRHAIRESEAHGPGT